MAKPISKSICLRIHLQPAKAASISGGIILNSAEAAGKSYMVTVYIPG